LQRSGKSSSTNKTEVLKEESLQPGRRESETFHFSRIKQTRYLGEKTIVTRKTKFRGRKKKEGQQKKKQKIGKKTQKTKINCCWTKKKQQKI